MTHIGRADVEGSGTSSLRAPPLDLAALVSPLRTDDFLTEHWPDRPYFSAAGPERLAALRAIPELDDIEATIESSDKVSFFAPDGAFVTGDHSVKLYRLGLTCYLSASHINGLMEVAEGLAADLGLASGALTCEIFCSLGPSGASMHSDRDLNFALLLRGRKRWRIAENHHIRNQTGMCRPTCFETHDPFQLEIADRTPFPAGMPDDAQVIDVEPGGLLYLPRGWWHETEADGDCVQVNFVMNRSMWVDVLTGGIRATLLRDPRWRAMAIDVFAGANRRETARAGFAALIGEWMASMEGVTPERFAHEVLEAAELKPAGTREGRP